MLESIQSLLEFGITKSSPALSFLLSNLHFKCSEFNLSLKKRKPEMTMKLLDGLVVVIRTTHMKLLFLPAFLSLAFSPSLRMSLVRSVID